MTDSGADLAAPGATRPDVSGGWVTRFGLLYLGQNIAWAAPAQLLVANQIAQWYPDDKESYLAWLMAAGGVVSLIATPLAGLISDRTVSRFGRRTPWIVVGAMAAALALVTMAFAGTYPVLFGGWLFFQLSIAFAINAAQTVPPDRVPQQQYGLVSGVMGLTYTLAVVGGTVIGAALPTRAAYLATAAVLVALTVQFVLGFREPSTARAHDLQIVESSPVSSASHSPACSRTDYWWVFAARLLVTLGQSIALFYLLYYLRDRIEYDDPDTGVLILTVVYAVAVVATAVLGGRWSDRIDRRKPFVAITSCGLAVAATMMAFAGSFNVVIVAALVLGASWGIYTAVDQALINEVLPDPDARGRDIGIMNIAVAVPNSAAPVIAAAALAHLGGYPGLYLLAAVLAVIGGLVVLRVKSVK